jgi:tRNA (guanine37-N1)-methyltransferase
MRIDVITLFPEIFAALQHSIPGRAQQQSLLELALWNPRDFAHDKHRTVDDRPYGGGPGMLMQVQPLKEAIAAAKNAHRTITGCDSEGRRDQDAEKRRVQGCTFPKSATCDHTPVIYLSPQGQRFTQETAQTWAKQERLILVAGRYEGIDQRLLETVIDEEWSIGDFVLSGGECAALCMIDAVTRLLPGTLGDDQSAIQDSFSQDLLDCPHYTRPENIDDLPVPEVLLSGDHSAIARWRLLQSLKITYQKRPDLLKKHLFTPEEAVLLAAFFQEQR